MSLPTTFPGFDGLMTLSRREGVDIRPTLLRVLTDLYVQSSSHTLEEEQQFVELTSRLIDEVDDATRAAVRARLSIYPRTPAAIAQRLSLHVGVEHRVPRAASIPTARAASPAAIRSRPLTEAEQRASSLPLQPDDAAQINDMFFAANTRERALILGNLPETPLRPAPRIYSSRAGHALEALHMAAFNSDLDNFTRELGDVLILSARIAEQVVGDDGGEPMACACKALDMPSAMFEQVLMFLDPDKGSSVERVYRLSRLYDRLSERAALIMLAAWRGATVANTRAKYRAALYNDERHRARSAAGQSRTASQDGYAIPARGAISRD
jgi:hypothetical protein